MEDNKELIRIKESSRILYDDCDTSKEWYDPDRNISYRIHGNQMISVPQDVATDWIAVDSTLERVYDPKY